MREGHGQRLRVTIVRAIYIILSPVTTGTTSFQVFRTWCAFSSRRELLSFEWLRWRGNDVHRKIQSAVRAGAVAIYIPTYFSPKKHDLHRVDSGFQDIIFVDGLVPNERQRLRCYHVPPEAIITSDINVIPQSSVLKNFTTLIQLAVSAFDIFHSNWSSIRKQGMASPYMLAIPYLLMSLLNMLTNVVVPTYPAGLVLRPAEKDMLDDTGEISSQ